MFDAEEIFARGGGGGDCGVGRFVFVCGGGVLVKRWGEKVSEEKDIQEICIVKTYSDPATSFVYSYPQTASQYET